MNYAKLYNGRPVRLIIFPNGACFLNGRLRLDPTPEEFAAAGFYPVKEQPEPESREGFIKSYRWVQTENTIVRKWTIRRDMRPISQDKISKMLIEKQINTLSVDDNTALRMKQFYPEWTAGVAYVAGYKVRFYDKLWRVRQSHTSQSGWEPSTATASLWEQVNEIHAGTLDDAIPYEGNMVLEENKYYTQGEEIYLCTRNSGNPVYHALEELTGLYVELI